MILISGCFQHDIPDIGVQFEDPQVCHTEHTGKVAAGDQISRVETVEQGGRKDCGVLAKKKIPINVCFLKHFS